MNYTSNVNLYKWNQSDKKSDTIAEMANNADKIDTSLATKANQSDLNTTNANVAANTGQIASNTNAIATNTANIAKNTTDIATVTSSLADNTKHRVEWINVKQAPYNAKGDGTDDTASFTAALNDLSSGGGTLYVPYGWKWGITSITIPKNVTLKMEKGVFDYSLANFTKDTNDRSLLDNSFIKLDDSLVMITCYGHIENVRINGNRKQGLAVDMRGTFDGLYITRASQAIKINQGGYQFKNLWLTGNLGDALTWGQNVSDSRLNFFNIWSNLGHGIVFTGGNGTIFHTSGKIEWNYRNNIEVTGYTNEVSFVDCIIDSANWYNIHIGSSGYMLKVKFTNCNFIGSRRDTSSAYGETTPLPTYTNQTFSQFYFESANIEPSFVNCFFRKRNSLTDGVATEQITHIFGGNSVTITYPFGIVNCHCTDFPFANWKTGIFVYIHNIIGTRFSDSPAFMGGIVTGEIVFPVTTGANITAYTAKKDGTAIFNQDDQSLNINMYGNNYKILTNRSGKWVSVPASATATGSPGDFSADVNYFYICYSTNLWRRVAITTW